MSKTEFKDTASGKRLGKVLSKEVKDIFSEKGLSPNPTFFELKD